MMSKIGKKRSFASTFVDPEKFHCAQFKDGILIVKNSWVKTKNKSNHQNVCYPAKYSKSVLKQNIEPEASGAWKTDEAIIECTHGNANDNLFLCISTLL